MKGKPASPESVTTMLTAEIGHDDGRSEWLWFWTPEGDLIFGCYPCGDTFFATEEDHSA